MSCLAVKSIEAAGIRILYSDFSTAYDVLEKEAGVLSDERRRKAEIKRNREARMQSLAAGMLLRECLLPLGIDEREANYSCKGNGKPYLIGYDNICFSITHSGRLAAAAAASSDKTELGIDIERIGRVGERVAAKCLSAAEQQKLRMIKNADERERFICRMWTVKESFVKAVGAGLAIPFDTVEAVGEGPVYVVNQKYNAGSYTAYTFELEEGYCLSLCVGDRVNAS